MAIVTNVLWLKTSCIVSNVFWMLCHVLTIRNKLKASLEILNKLSFLFDKDCHDVSLVNEAPSKKNICLYIDLTLY